MSYRPPAVSTIDRKEWIADIPWTSDAQLTLPINGGLLPNDRFMYGLQLQFEGRFTQPATGNSTGVQADGPYSIIDSILVQGYHQIRAAKEPFIFVRAADMYEDALELTGRAPLSTGTLSTAANGTSDIRFIIPVPFVPLGIRPSEQIGYLLDAPNYDSLQLFINAADPASVFTGQTGTIAMSAYGSSTGSPRIRVYGQFAQAGPGAFAGFVPGRVWRYFTENASSQLTTTATQQALFQLNKGYYLRRLLCKTGVASTATTAGYNAYNSLSDSILANIKVQRGLNKMLTFDADFYGGKEDSAQAYKITPSKGYLPIDWCRRGTLATLLNTVATVSGPTGDTLMQLVADVTGAANQRALLQYEELRGLPVTQ